MNASLDFMAIGAHPDDIEVGMGATVAKLIAAGKKGILLDLTRGQSGTRGDAATRMREAADAARILGLPRESLELPDGALENCWEFQKPIVEAIRKHRPACLFTHWPSDDHPDHHAAGELVKAARFKAGLRRLEARGGAFRPGRIFYWIGFEFHRPTFCVDVSAFWDRKLKALACFPSQFAMPGSSGFEGKTDLSKPAFLEFLENRARFLGGRIGKRYAEGYRCAEWAEVEDPTELGGERFP